MTSSPVFRTRWDNLGLVFVGGGGWDLFERISKRRHDLQSTINLVDISPPNGQARYTGSGNRTNRLDLSFPYQVGAERNPFTSRALFEHFKSYFAKKTDENNMVYVGCPGGGYNSGVLPLMPGLPPPAQANLCVAFLPGPHTHATLWDQEACNQVLALAGIMSAVKPWTVTVEGQTVGGSAKGIVATVLVESDCIALAHSEERYPAAAGEWQDVAATHCGSILDALSIYEHRSSGPVTNFGNWVTQAQFMGVNCETGTWRVECLVYMVPILFPAYGDMVPSAGLSDVGVLALDAYMQMGTGNSPTATAPGCLCDEPGVARAACLVVEGPRDYVQSSRCSQGKAAMLLSEAIGIPKGRISLASHVNDSIQGVRGCLFLASPPLKRFAELKDIATASGPLTVSGWKKSLEDWKGRQEDISRVIANVKEKNPLIAAQIGDWNRFVGHVDAQLQRIDTEWATAKRVLDVLVRYSEANGDPPIRKRPPRSAPAKPDDGQPSKPAPSPAAQQLEPSSPGTGPIGENRGPGTPPSTKF